MKNVIVIAWILILLPGFSWSQDFLSSFSIRKQEKEVHLNWVINAGYSCNGTAIQRSTDGVNFEEIGRIDGICGNVSEPESFDFVDLSPVPNIENHYRLDLGVYGRSDTRSLFYLDLSEDGYLLYPNPVSSTFSIRFNNPLKENLTFRLFDRNGILVFEGDAGNSEFFSSDLSNITDGLYFFVMQGNEKLALTGKMIVIHP